MTPDDVHRVTFAAAPFGQPGYRTDDVDDLLDRIAATLAGRATFTAADFHRGLRTQRGLFTRGYHTEEVDAFLERVRTEFRF